MMTMVGWVRCTSARWLVVLACATGGVEAIAAPPPAEYFTRWPAIAEVTISPSGKHVALRMKADSGKLVAAVVDLDTMGPPKVVAAFGDADVIDVNWVNDERLLLVARQPDVELELEGRGTFAVNIDGSGMRQLTAWRLSSQTGSTFIKDRTLNYQWNYLRSIDDGGSDVFMERLIRNGAGDVVESTLGRLNTVNGVLTTVSKDMPSNSWGWIFDAKHEPRVLSVALNGRMFVYWRQPGQDAWAKIAEFALYTEEGFSPLYLETDSQLIVSARGDRDTTALYVYDLKGNKLDSAPIAGLADFDFGESLIVDSSTRRLVGARTTTDRPVDVWFDDRLAGIQKSVDKALPAGRFNLLICKRCESAKRFVIQSRSDRQPPEYFVYDQQKAAVRRIGAAQPWITEDTQGRRSFHRFAARDGLSIPVYVTHPPGSTPTDALPAVVMIHGGPWVRGASLAWEADAQFLASRGYRVIEPEFRGSEGYGYALFRAGWKAWGTTMQDDLKDAVDWAAKERLIDPARVCLYGASYGGYAALMSPIRYPAAYRCAASFVGVTDIDLMYGSGHSDLSVQSKRYAMPTLIGDRVTDANLLRAASPLQRVAEIKIPILLAHGGLDRRVPIEHANKFASAAKAAGVKVEVVDYPHEGHGWYDPDNHTDFLNRLEAFLAKSMAVR